MTARLKLTARRVRELLHYDLETGHFTWKPRPSNPALSARISGKLAGHEAKEYWRIRFDGRNPPSLKIA